MAANTSSGHPTTQQVCFWFLLHAILRAINGDGEVKKVLILGCAKHIDF